MLKGKVKWFNTKKGYGFIKPEQGQKDIFIHVTQLEKNGLHRLYEGQEVNYQLYNDRGGKLAATDVELVPLE